MTAPETMTDCPTEETLAAFIDHHLTDEARTRVIAHLTECGDCREMVLMANDFAAADEPAAQPAVHPRFRRWVIPAAVAAAAVVALLFVPNIRQRLLPSDRMTVLVRAAESQEFRPSKARFSAGFSYKKSNTMRGGGEEHVDFSELPVLQALVKMQEAVDRDPSAENLRALGVALILYGPSAEEREAAQRQPPVVVPKESRNKNIAISYLERAAAKDPSPEILTDLAAAYLARSDDGDDQKALDLANQVYAKYKTPASAWNRATALELLGKDRKVIDAARQQYLALDPSSPWAEEMIAAQHFDREMQ